MSVSSRTRRVGAGRPIPLASLLGGHRRGAGDPTHRRIGQRWFRATRTPEGPALLMLDPLADGAMGTAWGEGADWALDQLPALLGLTDEVEGFAPLPEHPALVAAWHRFPHTRVGRSDLVFEAMAPAIIEQVVTGTEAYRAWRLLVTEFGEPAPGPTTDPSSPAYGMMVPPTPAAWARVPSWRFLAAGVEERRSRTLVGAARRGRAIERTLSMDPGAADSGLRSLPGVGAWTSAEVRQRAHGDADAWSIGDYHVGGWITYALLGEKLDDDAATEVLEPYRGHRFRVQLLLGLGAARPQRRGPRRSLPTHTPHATRGRS